MVKIVLHGKLAKKFNSSYNLEVSSVKEAVHALTLMVPAFREEFLQYDYHVYSITPHGRQYFTADDLPLELVVDNIHLAPKIQGRKSNAQKGVGKLIISAALFFVAGPAGAMIAKVGQAAHIAISAAKVTQAISSIAMMTAFRGVSLMLTPKEVDNVESKSISSENAASGVAVPLAYGEGYFDVIPISVLISSSGVNSFGGATQDNVDWTYIDA